MWVKLISNKFESQTSERRSSSEKKNKQTSKSNSKKKSKVLWNSEWPNRFYLPGKGKMKVIEVNFDGLYNCVQFL